MPSSSGKFSSPLASSCSPWCSGSLRTSCLLAFGAVLVAIILHASAEALVRYLEGSESLEPDGRKHRHLRGIARSDRPVRDPDPLAIRQRDGASSLRARYPSPRASASGASPTTCRKCSQSMPTGGFAARIAGIGGVILSGLGDMLLVLIAGMYIAASPGSTREGLVKLFPIRSPRTGGELAPGLWASSQALADVAADRDGVRGRSLHAGLLADRPAFALRAWAHRRAGGFHPVPGPDLRRACPPS